MSRYMLDTNMASFVIKGSPPNVRLRLATLPVDDIVVSSVTQGELLYGSALQGYPGRLTALIHGFLLRVDVLPWDAAVATIYADLRASCGARGINLSALDMMIAAHAVAAKAVLVTHDKAFSQLPQGMLAVEDWTI